MWDIGNVGGDSSRLGFVIRVRVRGMPKGSHAIARALSVYGDIVADAFLPDSGECSLDTLPGGIYVVVIVGHGQIVGQSSAVIGDLQGDASVTVDSRRGTSFEQNRRVGRVMT
jgi:hypothetical protein